MGIDDGCYDDPYNCSETENNYPSLGWIYNGNVLEGQSSKSDTWLLSPYTGYSDDIFLATSSGRIGNNYYVYRSVAVRPVLYLSSNVKIIDGDGSINNPYKLGL